MIELVAVFLILTTAMLLKNIDNDNNE